VGLGYVGLPLAVAFAQHLSVIDFDVSERHVKELEVTSPADNVWRQFVAVACNKSQSEENKLFVMSSLMISLSDQRGYSRSSY
jgi:UDP-N-acetyl-D-mannosaminuronate dehydrogenase